MPNQPAARHGDRTEEDETANKGRVIKISPAEISEVPNATLASLLTKRRGRDQIAGVQQRAAPVLKPEDTGREADGALALSSQAGRSLGQSTNEGAGYVRYVLLLKAVSGRAGFSLVV